MQLSTPDYSPHSQSRPPTRHHMHGRKVAVSCHNCSRRRLRCDRSKPGCNKCTASGLDCPGYGRILTWVEGASAKAKRPRQRSNEAGAGAAGAAGAVSQPAGHTAAGSLIASGTNAALPISVRESRFGHVDDVTRLYMEHCESNTTIPRSNDPRPHAPHNSRPRSMANAFFFFPPRNGSREPGVQRPSLP